MIKLSTLVEEVVDKRKFMKAALEIANAYARRGYDPREAVDDAAVSVKQTMGYELSDREKDALRKVVFVHPNFK